MSEIVWSLLSDYQPYFIVFIVSFIGVGAFFQIWKIQLEKAYVSYTTMLFKNSLSMKDAEKLFMNMFFKKSKGNKGEHKTVKQYIKSAIKQGRLVRIEFTYEGEMQVRYVAHDEELHSFRSMLFKQAKYIRALNWLRPFNIYKFTVHDLKFKEAINQ